ncbi:Asd/ArgC dimerization domain-containing protein [Bradyrhizobium canariense]|uniref:Asd/ArgC dimerization domain-containing protein n=1 Tax=Bradyrhizobium canariense TaxID=255045 RepID=UPI003D9AF71D
MAQAPGVKVVRPHQKRGPIPIAAAGQGDVLVGRIHKDISDPSGHPTSMFVAADQLLKGRGVARHADRKGCCWACNQAHARDDRSKPAWPKPRLTGSPPACSTCGCC